MTKHKLSLMSAIFVNVNIMLGSGIFINTVLLPKLAGFLGFTSYIIVACLILPIILSIAALIKKYPFGGFYTYGKNNLGTFAGFYGSWTYFVTKFGSAGLKIHVFSLLLQHAIPFLQTFTTLFLDLIAISVFTVLNLLNMKVSNRIGYLFIIIKLTPILFVFVSGLYMLGYVTIRPDMLLSSGLPATIPYVLYSYIGFEASCSLSQSLKNPERDGPRAILYSYLIVTFVSAFYQLLFYVSAGGDALIAQANYAGAFPTLIKTVLPCWHTLAKHLINLMHIAIGCSALGGSYGIFFSNHWNLHTIANHSHTFFSKALTTLNKHRIPMYCVLAEGVICFLFLAISSGNQAILQQLGALGPTVVYTLSVIGLVRAQWRGEDFGIARWIPIIGIGSCLILVGACIRNFILYGAGSLVLYSSVAGFGTIMYLAASWLNSTKKSCPANQA